MQAAGLLPQVGQQIISNQLGAGQITDSYNQNKINADMQKFEDERTAPIKAWSEVAPIATQMGQAFGTTKGTTKATKDNGLFGDILGGAMAAGGLLSGVPGVGTAIGGMFGATQQPSAQAPWSMTQPSYASGLPWAPYQAPTTPYAANGMFSMNNIRGA